METNKKIGIGLVLLGGAILVYGFFFYKEKSSEIEYAEPVAPPILANDDRTVFQGNPSDANDFVRGYVFPDKIEDLSPLNNQIFVITKPGIKVFSQEPRSGFYLKVNLENKTLSFTMNNGQTITEPYDKVKDAMVIADKKYIKS